MNNANYVVIMAGGIGSRFWPLSQPECPKQFLDILGLGKTFLQATVERFLPICPIENILIVTNQEYTKLVKKQLPNLPKENILAEPARKNTAPCIAFANSVIFARNSQANIVVSPSDHLIIHPDKFLNIIKTGLEFIRKEDALLTIGIKPTRPETGYGYIQINANEKSKNQILRIKTFTEKPNAEMANMFLKSGEFLWNSGIFLWNINSIRSAFEKYMPEVYHLFKEFVLHPHYDEKKLSYIYSECPNISIDYAIMEKADNVYVIKADFGWSDLGTWGSLYENLSKDADGNVIFGKNVHIQNSVNNYINVSNNTVSLINGVSNLIIVENDGKLLISDKNKEQDLRVLVNLLKK
ncbi:MAG: mannose-1-phosphate guanylyltransferase [Bacteroidales bacterium]|nr:mannose-1-phosphate guanylyltransferase [Bacteroidales bacterium]